MKSNKWRMKLEDSLRKHLELQIRETYKQKNAYESSKNPSNAQLWISIANLSRQIFEMNLRMNVLERALKDTLGKLNQSSLKKSTPKQTIKKKSSKKIKKKR